MGYPQFTPITQMEGVVKKRSAIPVPGTKLSSRASGGSLLFVVLLFFCLSFLLPAILSAQTQTGETQATGVLRLKVKPKVDGKDKELARKRFYLIKWSL